MGSKLTFPFDPLHTKLIRKGGTIGKILDPLGFDKMVNPPDTKPKPLPAPTVLKPTKAMLDEERRRRDARGSRTTTGTALLAPNSRYGNST